MVACCRVAQGPGPASLENAASGNAEQWRSRRTSQVQARLRSCLYSKGWAKRQGPVDKEARQCKLRQNLYNRRCFDPAQSADGEEWYDADAHQPQEYKVPDEIFMPTWYARMYAMPFELARAVDALHLGGA